VRWWWLVLLVAGCGRIGFEPGTAARTGDAGDRDGSTTLELGLELWMPFEVGAPLLDAVTNQLATCSSCGTAIPGPRGDDALALDGTSTCLSVPTAPELQAAEFTLAAWVFYAGGTSGTVLGKALSSGIANSYELWMRLNITRIEFQTSTVSINNQDLNSPTLQLDRWYHVAGTFTGTTKRVYIDGTEAASSTPDSPLVFSDQPVRIGCDEDGGTIGQHFSGAIDDVRYYSRALTSAEIAELAAP
jgi:Concanavalin A-like lectin/glucanases superfamily